MQSDKYVAGFHLAFAAGLPGQPRAKPPLNSLLRLDAALGSHPDADAFKYLGPSAPLGTGALFGRRD